MSRRRSHDDRGYSSVELVLYMPLLLACIVATVQFALIYLANEYASTAAREGNRTARITGDPAQGKAKGEQIARDMGDGMLTSVRVDVNPIGTEFIETVVRGNAPRIVPFLDIVTVSETVRGPVERFDPDDGP